MPEEEDEDENVDEIGNRVTRPRSPLGAATPATLRKNRVGIDVLPATLPATRRYGGATNPIKKVEFRIENGGEPRKNAKKSEKQKVKINCKKLSESARKCKKVKFQGQPRIPHSAADLQVEYCKLQVGKRQDNRGQDHEKDCKFEI